jgi:hypothetical protein
MGKEEVWERIWFVGRVEGWEGFRVRDVNWGLWPEGLGQWSKKCREKA